MKLKKSLTWTLIVLVSLTLLFSIGVYIFMETGGNRYLTPENKKEIVAQIKSSPSLDSVFLQAFNVIYPSSLDGGYWAYSFSHLISSQSKRKCPCKLAAMNIDRDKIDYENYSYNLAPHVISLELEDYLTQTECLNFITNNYDFGFKVVGVESASMKYFNKSIKELGSAEIAELFVIMKNPIYYSRRRNSKQFIKNRDELIQILDKG